MANGVFIYEFLWRGHAAESSEPPAYHVVLAEEVDLPGGGKQVLVGNPLTADQAEARGFPLSTILAEVNTASLAQVAALQTQVFALQAEKEALQALVPTQEQPQG